MKAATRERLALVAIVVAYLAVAVQYARLTPPWQAPDEPAHFNYVKFVAEVGALPVLQPGDYPHDYLEAIKAAGFPPHMSIASIRYEAWQPPLYYLAAALVYRLAGESSLGQQLLVLRLFSVGLGALLIVVAHRVVATLAPGRAWLSLGVAATVAAIPMHVATTAAVSNDTLSELWVALVLWQLLLILRRPQGGLRPWLGLGATLGLAGLTKLSTCVVGPLVVGVLAYAARGVAPAERGRFAARRLAASGLVALLLVLPWLAHNVTVYGLSDPFVFRQHAAVVVGQERTSAWLARVGLARGLVELATTTWHSFWGQFGWMGVPIDSRLYRGLTLLSAVAGLGLLLRLSQARRQWERLAPEERAGLCLLGGLALLVGASFLWYNLSFKQHQGRYLFPALIPLGVLGASGWREVTRRAGRPLAAVALVAMALVLAVAALCRGARPDRWVLAGTLALAGAFSLPGRLGAWLYALPYPLLLLLDVLCLYRFILPALARPGL